LLGFQNPPFIHEGFVEDSWLQHGFVEFGGHKLVFFAKMRDVLIALIYVDFEEGL
jgi:hypothetical protein